MNHAIELCEVSKSFGRTAVIQEISLAIPHGERHAVIGPNGAGKSTLFNLVSGRQPTTAGRILLKGVDVAGRQPYEITRMGLSRSFQITNVFHRLTVLENIRCGVLWSLGYRYGMLRRVDGRGDIDARVSEVLAQIRLEARRDVSAGELTYAEQRALEIGITIAGSADVLLLDEPTAGMSRSETSQIVQLIAEIAQDRTLVIVEHDMGVVFDLADRISVLVYGRVLASGTPDEIRGNPEVQEAYLGKPAT